MFSLLMFLNKFGGTVLGSVNTNVCETVCALIELIILWDKEVSQENAATLWRDSRRVQSAVRAHRERSPCRPGKGETHGPAGKQLCRVCRVRGM